MAQIDSIFEALAIKQPAKAPGHDSIGGYRQRARRLLFLDFDGVLHPTSVTENTPLFCREHALQDALAGNECAIVISSSWRHHYPAGELLTRLSPATRERVVGFTGEAYIGKWPRYQEIQVYLMKNQNPSWRALDDSWNEFLPGCPDLLWCDPNRGIDESQVSALNRWLSYAIEVSS